MTQPFCVDICCGSGGRPAGKPRDTGMDESSRVNPRPTEHYRPAWSHQIVRCRCGWSGPWCEAERGYRGDNMSDVYGVTECPECGREL